MGRYLPKKLNPGCLTMVDTDMMRKRTHNTAVIGVIDALSIDYIQEKHTNKNNHAKRRQYLLSCVKFVMLTCFLALLGLLILAISDIDPAPSKFVASLFGYSISSTKSISFAATAPMRDWSQCTTNARKAAVKFERSKLDTTDKVEPLWLPAYPTSLPGKNSAIYSNLLRAITGIESASRNYYRSSKKLKRCHYIDNPSDVGVTCEIVHPIVPCERPHPSVQSPNFGKVVLVALRNPITAFPAYHQEKAEKYHGAKSQVERSEWVKFRDEFVGNTTHSPLFEEWKHFILEWRNMHPYFVAMYLPYEWWSDEVKGPALVVQLAKLLKKEGLPVLYDTPDRSSSNNPTILECLWLKQVDEAIKEEKQKQIEWYTPNYNPDLARSLAAKLDAFAKEIAEGNPRPGDEVLINILYEYRDSIIKTAGN